MRGTIGAIKVREGDSIANAGEVLVEEITLNISNQI